RVIMAGDYSVELAAKAGVKGSTISAFAFDASGAAAAKGDLDLSLRLGAGAFVKLLWDAPSASYRAAVDALVDLDTQPITIALKADGKAFVGASLPSVSLDSSATVGSDVKTALDAKAKAALDARAALDAKANVKAPTAGATVKIEAPKIKATSGTTGAAATGGAASAKAGFSFGTK
ncbi:MAG: hypothetical protein JWM74_6121, partial [Myxococcaceae bacterium]|nr:hypothetical protein [Myxococcaceae bacterium]